MRLWERTKTGGKMNPDLKVIGTYELSESHYLPCRAIPLFSDGENLLLALDGRLVEETMEILSDSEYVESPAELFDNAFSAKQYHCLLQVRVGRSKECFEYIAEENLERRLAEIGIEAVKNAKSFLDEGKEDEAEKLLWYAARAMPKSASVLMLLRIVLKGKISEEEMKVLDRKIQELTVV